MVVARVSLVPSLSAPVFTSLTGAERLGTRLARVERLHGCSQGGEVTWL